MLFWFYIIYLVKAPYYGVKMIRVAPLGLMSANNLAFYALVLILGDTMGSDRLINAHSSIVLFFPFCLCIPSGIGS